MALPTSGPLSLSQIAAEFGGTPPHSLSEYYGKAAGIPTSGTISIGQFYGKTNIFYVNITASAINPNIRALAQNAGWDGNAPVVVNITAPLINKLDLGTVAFPGGITINVSSATRIGGRAGTAGLIGGYGVGGPAFITRVPVTLNNQGIISGGGGKGGVGGSAWVRYLNESTTYWGNGGDGGWAQGFFADDTLNVRNAASGDPGTYEERRGATVGGGNPWAQGGNGGAGGTWGMNGTWADGGYVGGNYSASGAAQGSMGQSAGASIDGRSFVTLVAQGTLLGPQVN